MTLANTKSLRLFIGLALIVMAGLHFWIHRPFYWVWIIVAVVFLISAVPRRHLVSAVIVFFVFVFAAIHLKSYIRIGSQYDGFQNLWDSGENLVGAYTIATRGIYSINLEDPQPTTRREPLYPLVLAGFWKMLGAIDSNGVQFSWTGKNVDHLKFLNVAILACITVISAHFVFRQTGRPLLSLIAAGLLLFNGPLIESAHTLLTEVPAALILLLISIVIFRYLERTRNANWITAMGIGVLCGALFFIKTVYLLMIPLVMLLLLFPGPPEFRQRFRASLIVGMCAIVLLVPWFVRNYFVCGNVFPADRSAEMTITRALYDAMSPEEYRLLFVVWTPGAGKFLLPKDNPSAWQRTIGGGYDGINREAYARIIDPYFGQYDALPNASYEQSVYLRLQQQGLQQIANNISGYLRLSVAFVYRSLFIDDGRALRMIGFAMAKENGGYGEMADCLSCALLFNLPEWAMFFFLISVAIVRRRWALLGLVLPVAYTVFSYSFLAFSTPRYIQPVVPSLVIILALGIDIVLSRLELRLDQSAIL